MSRTRRAYNWQELADACSFTVETVAKEAHVHIHVSIKRSRDLDQLHERSVYTATEVTTKVSNCFVAPAIKIMAASNQRAKSALTRHTGRLENEFSENELASRVSSSRRVQSARERKMSQESSHVFPSELYSPSVGGDRWKTMYSEDYESKASTRPSSARPTSPTRRNNPHPRQVDNSILIQFLHLNSSFHFA